MFKNFSRPTKQNKRIENWLRFDDAIVHSKSSITALFLENGRNWRTDNLKCNFQPLLI
jgi:hypothetical protein